LGFEVKKHFGLSVLNYIVTSKHVHLLVKATDGAVIARSMQLIAGGIGRGMERVFEIESLEGCIDNSRR
jgi:putative transposase